MSRCAAVFVTAGLLAWGRGLPAQEVSLESAPPVVVKTVPESGTSSVDPALKELRVTFSKPMTDQSWSSVQLSAETSPPITGKPKYDRDGKTWVLPVSLKPGRVYALWLNTERFGNFKDRDGQSAVPYLLIFRTRGPAPAR